MTNVRIIHKTFQHNSFALLCYFKELCSYEKTTPHLQLVYRLLDKLVAIQS